MLKKTSSSPPSPIATTGKHEWPHQMTLTGCLARPLATARSSAIPTKKGGSLWCSLSTKMEFRHLAQSYSCYGAEHFRIIGFTLSLMIGMSCFLSLTRETGQTGATFSGCAARGRMVQSCDSTGSQSIFLSGQGQNTLGLRITLSASSRQNHARALERMGCLQERSFIQTLDFGLESVLSAWKMTCCGVTPSGLTQSLGRGAHTHQLNCTYWGAGRRSVSAALQRAAGTGEALGAFQDQTRPGDPQRLLLSASLGQHSSQDKRAISNTLIQLQQMPKRQAAVGEVTEGVAATYTHGEDAAAEVAADLRDGIREMVAVNLMPSTVWSLVYTAHGFPTIDNVELLQAEAQFWGLGEERLRHLLTDTSQRTAVEEGNGHFPGVKAKRKVSRLSSTAELAAIFDESVLPAHLQHATRQGY